MDRSRVIGKFGLIRPTQACLTAKPSPDPNYIKLVFNRFFKDCPSETQQFNVSNDPIETCNHYIKSEPDELDEAYWKIRGVYVYEREMRVMSHSHEDDDDNAESSSTES